MMPEECGKDIARRLAAGMPASRLGVALAASALAGIPGRRDGLAQVHVPGDGLMSDDDFRRFVEKVGPMVRLRLDGDDGAAGALMPA